MNIRIKRYAGYTLLSMMTLAISFNGVLAQEEAEVVESSSSIGLMIGIIGLGLLVILALGATMNAQAKEETKAQE